MENVIEVLQMVQAEGCTRMALLHSCRCLPPSPKARMENVCHPQTIYTILNSKGAEMFEGSLETISNLHQVQFWLQTMKGKMINS